MRHRTQMVVPVLTLWLLASGSALAQTSSTLLQFRDAYLLIAGTGGWPSINMGATGTLVGHVTAFPSLFPTSDPAADSLREYTMICTGCRCTSITYWDDLPHNRGGAIYDFSGGALTVYEDTTPDASLADLATFQDGARVLTGDLLPFTGRPGVAAAELAGTFGISGGDWGQFIRHGDVLPGRLTGTFSDDVSANLRVLGFRARLDGELLIDWSVPVRSMTWGRVKALYAR